MKDKILPLIKTLGAEIKSNVFTKWIGFAIGLIAAALAVSAAAVYGGISPEFYSPQVLVFTVLAAVTFILLSVFGQTSSLAPVALFIFDFLALLAFVSSVFETALLDEITTVMFGGFSMDLLMRETYGQSAVLIVISTLISAVAIYVPQNSDWLYNRLTAKKNASGGACGEVK